MKAAVPCTTESTGRGRNLALNPTWFRVVYKPTEPMHYTYILKSLKDNKLYIGQTDDLKRRFNEHQRGKNNSTKARRPFELIFYEAFLSKSDAIRRERYFKSTKGKSSLKQMLRDSLKSSIA